MGLIILQNFRDKTFKSDILVRENTYPMHLYKDISVLINRTTQGNAFFCTKSIFWWNLPIQNLCINQKRNHSIVIFTQKKYVIKVIIVHGDTWVVNSASTHYPLNSIGGALVGSKYWVVDAWAVSRWWVSSE